MNIEKVLNGIMFGLLLIGSACILLIVFIDEKIIYYYQEQGVVLNKWSVMVMLSVVIVVKMVFMYGIENKMVKLGGGVLIAWTSGFGILTLLTVIYRWTQGIEELIKIGNWTAKRRYDVQELWEYMLKWNQHSEIKLTRKIMEEFIIKADGSLKIAEKLYYEEVNRIMGSWTYSIGKVFNGVIEWSAPIVNNPIFKGVVTGIICLFMIKMVADHTNVFGFAKDSIVACVKKLKSWYYGDDPVKKTISDVMEKGTENLINSNTILEEFIKKTDATIRSLEETVAEISKKLAEMEDKISLLEKTIEALNAAVKSFSATVVTLMEYLFGK